jgi:tRNA1(Val) A37 N6-methylase TrmN6
MGAGVGGVSLCLARRLDAVQITAIEIDPGDGGIGAAECRGQWF